MSVSDEQKTAKTTVATPGKQSNRRAATGTSRPLLSRVVHTYASRESSTMVHRYIYNMYVAQAAPLVARCMMCDAVLHVEVVS